MSVLSFVLQLISKNPNKDKKQSFNTISSQFKQRAFFSKDEMIRNTKALVNKYYGLGE